MKLIKIKTPSNSLITIDISKFVSAKKIEKNILEVTLDNEKNSFLIKGDDIKLERIIDELIEEKNAYEKEFLYKEEKEMFYTKLVERLSGDLLEINKDLLKEQGLDKIKAMNERSEKLLNRLDNYEKHISENKEDLNEITKKIKEIKKELF